MKLTLILSAILVGWLSQNPAFAAETPDKKSHSHADHAPQTSHQEGEEVHDDEAHHENETDHTHTDEEHRNDEKDHDDHEGEQQKIFVGIIYVQ